MVVENGPGARKGQVNLKGVLRHSFTPKVPLPWGRAQQPLCIGKVANDIRAYFSYHLPSVLSTHSLSGLRLLPHLFSCMTPIMAPGLPGTSRGQRPASGA